MEKNIQNIFFSKENISTLNKTLLNDLKLQNTTTEVKKDILQILVEIMSSVWRNIDKTKINNNNFKNIFSQFNSHSLQNAIKKLKIKYNSNFTGITASNPQQPYQPQQQPYQPQQQPYQQPYQQPQQPYQPRQSYPTQKNDLNKFYSHLTPGLPDAYEDPNVDPANLKFKRDFDINKGKQVIVPDRSKSVIGGNEVFIRQSEDMHKLAGNFQPGVENMFKPIINNPPDEPIFNNYKYQKGDATVKQIDDIKIQRDSEAYITKKPNETTIPDFLKPKATSIRSQDDYQTHREHEPRNEHKEQPTKKSLKMGGNTQSEFLSGINNVNDDLMSLDNFDKLITDENIVEDNTPFSEKLNRLKADRDNVTIKQSNVNFQSENFEDTYDDIEPTSIKDLKNKKKTNDYDKREQMDNDRRREQMDRRDSSDYDRRREQMDRRDSSDYDRRRELMDRHESSDYDRRREQTDQSDIRQEEIEVRQEQPEYNKRLNIDINELYNNYIKIKKAYEITNEENLKLKIELDSKLVQKNKKLPINEKKEFIEIFNDLKKINERLTEEIKNLKNVKITLETDLKTLKETQLSPELLDLEKIKKDIQHEFVELTKHKQETENKIKEYENNKNVLEITKIETENIIKELETKQIEYQKVIDEYNKIPQVKLYQMEICNENNSSYYTYNFDQLDNIYSIKLLNYSIPPNIFNIEEDKNNTFEFQFNEDENLEIKLETGKYNIDDLLKTLNNNNYELTFELDHITQKVIVKSKNIFKILSSPLSSILGFNNNEYIDKTEYKAYKMFDLRSDNKVLLYLNNIDNQNPFAILIPNSTSSAVINFEEPTTLNKLDILFKDSKGRIYNFYNLEHSISLQIEVRN